MALSLLARGRTANCESGRTGYEPTVDTIVAHVPGNVELDLQAAGILPEPFYADNIRKLRPYEFYEWWYTRDFDLPLRSACAALAAHLCRIGHDCHHLGQRRRGR